MNIQQVANAILETGVDITYLVVGEPGTGKSSILTYLKEEPTLSNHQFIYIDCPVNDVPDVQLPYVEAGVSYFATNSSWGVNDPRPKVIMLDELSKSNTTTRLLFTRLLLEKQIGAYKLPEGSIVFATGNQSKDGVGDSFPAHMLNRVTEVHMDKPGVDAWCNWASNAGVDPIVMAWVNQFPHALSEGEEDNPYTFNPKTNNKQFVSPRSLDKASRIISKRDKLDSNTLHESLVGTIGASAAVDIMAYIQLANQLPSWKVVMSDPKNTPVPTSVAAQLIMAYGALQTLTANDDAESCTAVVEYLSRYPLEVSAVAFSSLARNAPMHVKRNVLRHPVVSTWVKENAIYLAG
jgi:hypothetical protein